MRTIQELRETKRMILKEIMGLGDMRKGSVVDQFFEPRRKGGVVVRLGPYPLYSYHDKGKTVSRRLQGPSAAEVYREQIGEFRKFRRLCGQLVDVSQQICELASLEEDDARSSGEKKRRDTSRKRSKGK